MKNGWFLLVCLAAMLSNGSNATTLEEDHQLSMAFETPHIRWGRPLASGPVRMLFFVYGRGTCPREIVELMQRFDLDAEAVYWERVVDTSKTQWLGGNQGEERISRLLEKSFDCYVFFDLPLTRLGLEQQYRLLKKVTEGKGLVFVGQGDERVLQAESLLQELPAPLGKRKDVAGYQVKEGRAVLLPQRPEIPYDLGWVARYEDWQLLLGSSILWAAGRETQVDLSLEMENEPLPWGTLADQWVKVCWSRDSRGKLTLDLSLRSLHGERVPLHRHTTRRKNGQISLNMPRIPSGKYRFDLIAASPKGKQAWMTQAFSVSSDRIVSEVSLDRDWGEVGEVLSGSIKLEGEALPKEKLRVDWVDRFGRVLLRQGVAIGDEMKFSQEIQEWMPMLNAVEVSLLSENQLVSRKHVFFRKTQRNRDQFNFLVWDVPKGTLAAYAEESMARLGTTLHLAHGDPPLTVAAYDIAWVPYTTRILAPLDENGIMKPCCWNDDEAINAHVKSIVDAQAAARQHGVFAYSLGDETVTRGSCLHPACMAAYRAYLQEQYGEIASLNASWGESYKSFEEVQLLDPKDNEEKGALEKGIYPRWYDRKAFQSHNFTQLCGRFVEAFKGLDPQARTGFEGAGRFDRGDDFDLIVRTNEFWTPYPGPGDEVIRSIAPPDFPRSNWMGYRKEAKPLIAKYWRMVTRGCDAVWWWRWDCIGRFNGFLAPHLGPWPATRELAEETRIVREGLGDLLIRSKMRDDGIAILYSMPSCLACGLREGSSLGDYTKSHRAWHKILRENGLQFRYVTDRSLASGEFEKLDMKTLLLSQAAALGSKEAEAIRAFVKQGGTLLADLRPGCYDGHCKSLEQGALDDLFESEAVGEGRAVLLDVDPSSEPSVLDEQVEEFFPVEGRVCQRIKNLETIRWDNGEQTIMAFFRHEGEGQRVVTIMFPEEVYFADLRQQRKGGPTREISARIHTGRPTFLVLSPKPFASIKVEGLQKGVMAGTRCTLKLSFPDAAGLHGIRLWAEGPEGQEGTWWERVLTVGSEPVEVTIPVAFNEALGKWTLHIRDILPGKDTVVPFTVEPWIEP